MADWYYTQNGEQRGPVSPAQLRQLAQAGDLQPTDLVFKEGGKEWVAASTVPNLFAKAPSPVRPGPAAPPARRDDRDRDRGRDRDEGALAFDDGDDEPRDRRRAGRGGFGDFLMFRRMIAPYIIMAIFWLGSVGYSLFLLFSAGSLVLVSRGAVGGLLFAGGLILAIPLAILGIRLYCEIMILVFRMNETLTDIKDLLKKQNSDNN
jgi:hypothetical protein